MKIVGLTFDRPGLFAARFLAVAVVVFLLALNSQAQQFRNSIHGFIFNSQRSPVPEVTVELTNEVYQVLQRTRTNGSGRYFFGNLSSGKFVVRILPLGTDFEGQSREVEIVNFVRAGSSTSDSKQEDFYLRNRKTDAASKNVTGTLFAQEVPEEAQRAYDKGVADLDQKRTEAGVQSLMQAVKIFPDYFAALERLGREYIALEKYDFAWAAFLKAASVNERSFNSWYGLAYAAYGLQEPRRGIAAAQKAVEINAGSVDAILLLGILERQAKDFVKAEKSLLRAKQLAKGTKPDVNWNLALLYANDLNRFEDAANELELYLKASVDESKKESVRKLIAEFRQKAGEKK